MEFLFLALALLLRALRVLLPWAMAFLLTALFMDLAHINAFILPVFLFGFFFIGLFLRDNVFPLIFKDK